MLMAAFGDVHGNLPALEAVLGEIDQAGIQTILNTGDCVTGAQWPNEVIQVLQHRHIITVQGLADRRTVTFLRKREAVRLRAPDELDAIAQAYDLLHSANLEFLRDLPKNVEMTVDGIAIALCHGTPGSQSDALREGDNLARFRRQRERVAGARLIVCGRTHEPFARLVDDTLFVNPGAVGVGPLAAYALIDTEREPWTATFRQVAYTPRT